MGTSPRELSVKDGIIILESEDGGCIVPSGGYIVGDVVGVWVENGYSLSIREDGSVFCKSVVRAKSRAVIFWSLDQKYKALELLKK